MQAPRKSCISILFTNYHPQDGNLPSLSWRMMKLVNKIYRHTGSFQQIMMPSTSHGGLVCYLGKHQMPARHPNRMSKNRKGKREIKLAGTRKWSVWCCRACSQEGIFYWHEAYNVQRLSPHFQLAPLFSHFVWRVDIIWKRDQVPMNSLWCSLSNSVPVCFQVFSLLFPLPFAPHKAQATLERNAPPATIWVCIHCLKPCGSFTCFEDFEWAYYAMVWKNVRCVPFARGEGHSVVHTRNLYIFK